ncbi:MAG: ATP-binding protein, partial [Actinomycetota bacterium]|nr:ATP-binding protein [Actinomycetota bacterium]
MSDESGWEQQLRERLHDVFVAEAAERLDALDVALLALEGGSAGPDVVHHLSEAFRQAHTLKGGARAAGLADVERIAHALEDAFERLRRGAGGGPDTWGAIYAAVDALRALVAGRAADVERIVDALGRFEPAPATPAATGPAAAPALPPPPGGTPITVRVPMARLEHLMAEIRELHATIGVLRQRAAEARSLAQSSSRLGRFLRQRRRRRALAGGVSAALTVPDEGLELIDEFGHLRRRLDGDVHRLEQVAVELHETVRRLRLIPVGVAVAGLPRLVRDIATACGKQARLVLVGEDTEVDRSVLEEISGALTHLVRNAVDHGLEDPDRRAAQGKPVVGVVTVAAREEHGTLILEVSDDGAGIDAATVRRRGVELGLVSAEQAAAAGLDLVFAHGFSTAGRITGVSGRGVGLDAVRVTVESLQGTVTLRTEPGAGTTFTLTLPLTLATTRSLVLRSAGHTLALPLGTVSRLVRVGEDDIDRDGAVLRGTDPPMAVAELATVLGLRQPPGGSQEPWGGNPAGNVPAGPFRLAVVSAAGTTPAAVLVDEIRGDEEIVVNSLPAPL